MRKACVPPLRFPQKLSALLGLGLLLFLGTIMTGSEPTPSAERTAADRQFEDGNFKDAFESYQKLAFRPTADRVSVVRALDQGLNALSRLGRENEIDTYREKIAEIHAQNWYVLQGVASSYTSSTHYGFLVEGEFVRGNRRGQGGAEMVDATQRDRARALQLFEQARGLIDSAKPEEQENFYWSYANAILSTKEGPHSSWKLQSLTDLTTLPDYDRQQMRMYRGFGGEGNSSRGAAVDADGNPVFYKIPESWENAQNDGERWRWLLEQAKKAAPNPQRKARVDWAFAEFLHSNFGVQTMQDDIRPLMTRLSGSDSETAETKLDEKTGPFAVSTLKETETIAKLANGVKRFTLPDEFNYIFIFQNLANDPEFAVEHDEAALRKLAEIFENRMQYPRAAEYWKESLKRNQENKSNNEFKQQQLSQIVDPWGTFEQMGVQAAGSGADLTFRFRNGTLLQLEAQEINYQQLLTDIKASYKSKPANPDWSNLSIENLGYRLVENNETKYLGKKVAEWEVELTPNRDHFDRITKIPTPLKKAGAYFLTAKLKDGNTSRIIVWIDDTAIIQKRFNEQQWYFIADAKTGSPIPGAKLDFFGYKNHYRDRKVQVTTSEFVDQSDKNGQLIVGPKRLEADHNWLVTASTPDGRFAYLGFNHAWYQSQAREEYQQNRVYVITDRPVYRPAQKVQFKVWAQKVDYTQEGKSAFAGQTLNVVISNPRGEKVLEKKFTADDFGGFEGELELPKQAILGQYNIQINGHKSLHGYLGFRVEEYKKPEFEVTVEAPQEPVKLGEKINATVRAKYYFGAPVTQATVVYKVERTAHDSQWYPTERWDWLYGNGYWWFGQNYDWYPGFSRWGCIAPLPPWVHRSSGPPELVLENEVPIGPDGTVNIEIDTLLAREIHGDQDHKYTITAEVVDQSRRTIVGTGSVLASRDPFQVHLWLNRGYYSTGETVHASIKAQTLDQKPIQGTGELKLFSISYNAAGQPKETLVESWPLNTQEDGTADHKFNAVRPGQFRLSYQLKDEKGNEQEGAFIFLVRGEDSTLADYRFDNLELIADQKTYQPGETVKLMINTNRPDSTVLLFVRPVNGVYSAPQLVQLKGKSTVVDIGVEPKDMPNFHVEAITLADAKVFQEVREIAVPPEKRAINVVVEPSSNRYLPGQEAEVVIKLTDLEGKPITGSSVLTVYDRSVEYISGGSNVPEIQEFFWNFRRSHNPNFISSLNRYLHNLTKQNEERMQQLGIFGNLSADLAEVENAEMQSLGGGMGGGMGGMGAGRALSLEGGMPAPTSAPMMMKSKAADAIMESAADSADNPSGPQPTIRSEFADTAYWNGLITPDENGVAKLKFKMPDNLTDWKFKVWSIGNGASVGEGESSAVTAKDVLVRLQGPRFFVEKDEVVISANIHNYLKNSKQAQVELVLEGNTLESLDVTEKTVTIEADGEVRVDWRVKVLREGSASITVKALTDEDSDAMKMTFPVYVHGMLKTESFTGVLRPADETGRFQILVPAERRPEQTRLEVRYSPTLAGALVDALPYLIDYPYGCTEQTLNRFIPSVITQNVLKRMGVDLEEINKKQTNLNAQEIGNASERAKQWKRYERNPVFDTAEMDEIVKTNLKKLADMQLSDGGWGWFSGYGERSYPHTTAVVVRGLQLAVKNGLLLPDGMLERGAKWLETYQNEQVRLLKRGEEKNLESPYKTSADNLDSLVYQTLIEAGVKNQAMQDYLYRDRTKLSVYALAIFGVALQHEQVTDRLDMVLQNIEQYYVEDLENETAYLKLPEGNRWWNWYGSDIEANAYYLKLVSKTDPQGTRGPRLVKYLLNNRKHSTYWNSTRDTALCIEAMADFMSASGEDQPELTLEVLVNGAVKKTVTINKENLLTFDGTLVLEGEELTTGQQTIEFRKTGKGPIYWNAYLTNFTLEDPIQATGLELKVRRKVYKLIPQKDAKTEVSGDRGQVVNQSIVKYDRVELKSGDELVSGDLLEIELGIDSKNDYEYIILEDFKAAGTEPTEVRSGYLAEANGAYVEFRDEKVAFFVGSLPRGTSSMKYQLRAEIPGRFSALPTISYGMYAPELKANSDEFKLLIQDR